MLEEHDLGQETGTTESWPDVLDGHGVQFLLVDRHNDDDLLKRFQSEPEWIVDFEDEEAVLFVRVDISWATGSRARTHNDIWASVWGMPVRLAHSRGS